MGIEEQLAIFLSVVGQNKTNREMQERFQHSGETISRHFNNVLKAMEGSANDSKILQETFNNPKFKFPTILPEKYFVVDAGYPNRKGFLAPSKGERYHLQDYRGGRNVTNARKLFNYRHSSLRSVIERCFGVLKNRFPILKLTHGHPLSVQKSIVIATYALHNYIRQIEQDDELFVEYEEKNSVHSDNDRGYVDDIRNQGSDGSHEVDMDLF
ncbi:hypothetical protein LIER_36504 [Lithospermum erythrorhizon]|uniref:DUF8040 domain-containing protein n=1 Tax=Lithospermum erythrorhizon TaxID=34254 RepID=A0AAV3P6Z5_LITER